MNAVITSYSIHYTKLYDDQHADHQLGIDRRAAHRAVERREEPPDVREIDEAIYPPQKVIAGDVTFTVDRAPGPVVAKVRNNFV